MLVMSEGIYTSWRKSSYSNSSGNCVEVASADWRKSTRSNDSGNCVEVASPDHVVAVRDTRQASHGPLLKFSEAAWRRFLAEVKSSNAVR
jgi:hypothetical protein